MRTRAGILGVWAILLLASCQVYGQGSIRWESNLEDACRQAAAANRLVLIHFTAPWCVYCHKMDQEVLSHPSVEQAILADYVPVRLNVVQAEHAAIARQYGVKSLPTDVVVTPDGRLLDRQPGFVERQPYLARLQQVVAETRRSMLAAGQRQPSIPSPGANPVQMTQPEQMAYAPPATATPPAMAAPPAMAVPSQPVGLGVPPSVAGTPAYAPPGPAFGSGAMGGSMPTSPNPALASRDPVSSNGPAMTGIAPRIDDPVRQTPVAPTSPGWPEPSMQPGGPAVDARAAAGPSQTSPPGVSAMANPYSAMPSDSSTAPAAPAGNPPAMAGPEQRMPPEDMNGSPFGLDGFCPVELVEKEQWSVGDVRWGVNHRGCTYLFSGPEQQQRFLQDPDRYSPVASGIDLVLRVDEGRMVPGRRQHGVFFPKGGRIFLFANEASLERFSADPMRYVERLGEFEQAARGAVRR